MKLHEGIYENLITGQLQASMNQATDEGLVCMKADIDTAETPTMLADHIRNMVANRLSDENLTVEERVHFANRLIEYIGEADDFSVGQFCQSFYSLSLCHTAISCGNYA